MSKDTFFGVDKTRFVRATGQKRGRHGKVVGSIHAEDLARLEAACEGKASRNLVKSAK